MSKAIVVTRNVLGAIVLAGGLTMSVMRLTGKIEQIEQWRPIVWNNTMEWLILEALVYAVGMFLLMPSMYKWRMKQLGLDE